MRKRKIEALKFIHISPASEEERAATVEEVKSQLEKILQTYSQKQSDNN